MSSLIEEDYKVCKVSQNDFYDFCYFCKVSSLRVVYERSWRPTDAELCEKLHSHASRTHERPDDQSRDDDVSDPSETILSCSHVWIALMLGQLCMIVCVVSHDESTRDKVKMCYSKKRAKAIRKAIGSMYRCCY